MAAQSPMEEELNLYLSENGHLSFENPNYRVTYKPTVNFNKSFFTSRQEHG